MKVNAPEKIQLGFVENENHSLKIRGISYLEETQDGLIEYIRTDAFIEKVQSFLNKHHDGDYYTIGYIKKHFSEIIKEIGL